MHIPSARVYREMRSEDASLWIVPANGGDELAVLIKAPSSCIKALIAGCDLSILIGLNGPHLCAGAQISDMPDAPILISGAIREQEEQDALARLLLDRTAPVFLFNEMDVCLAWTNLSITSEHATEASQLLASTASLYVGPFTPDCSFALDCFCLTVDPTADHPDANPISIVPIPVALEPWRANNVSFISVRGSHTITINDHNEGEMFERAIWASLESVFPLTLHKSPQVQVGSTRREFTDVFTYHEYGSFLIEAKDLSVLAAGYGRDQERRTKGVQKQALKAIAQLVGARKALTRGERIYTSMGEELHPVRDKPAHCIVLITELMHWGDWSEVEAALMKAMRDTSAFFHLFDLRELITLLKGSSGNPALLDYNLIERCKAFAKVRSVFIRTRVAPTNRTDSDDNGKSDNTAPSDT